MIHFLSSVRQVLVVVLVTSTIVLLAWTDPIHAVDTKTKKKQQKKLPKIDPRSIVISNSLRNMCGTRYTPISKKMDEKRLQWLVASSGEGSLLLPSSPQKLAACWILYNDSVGKKRGSNMYLYLQRYAVAVLHYSSTKSNTTAWDWPMAADTPQAIHNHGNWLHPKVHECKWYGIVCENNDNFLSFINPIQHNTIIYELQLGFMKLDGLIPREVSLLTNLRDIDFHANDFQGVLPHKMIDSLTNIRYLKLHMNGFFGSIHKEIISMKYMKELILFGNYFAGRIPKEIGALQQLEIIDLYANQLSGKIPTELGQLKKLQLLDVHDNNLTGSMPREVCNLKVKQLVADCLGPKPEVQCDCCTICCRGLPDFKCVDQRTGQEIIFGR